jgi:hypothetical protein
MCGWFALPDVSGLAAGWRRRVAQARRSVLCRFARANESTVIACFILACLGCAANGTEAPARKAGMLYWHHEQLVGAPGKERYPRRLAFSGFEKKPQLFY